MKKMFVLIITTLLVLTSCQKTTKSQPVEPTKEVPVIKANAELKIGGNRPTFKLVEQQIVVEQGTTVDPKSYIVSGTWDSLEVPPLDTTKVGHQDLVFNVTKGNQTDSYTLAVEVVEKKHVELPSTSTKAEATQTTTTTETVTNSETSYEPAPAPSVEPSQPTVEPAPSPQPEPTPEPAPIVEEPAPVVEAPYRLEELGNTGMEFDTWDEAEAWAEYQVYNVKKENGFLKYRAYVVYGVMWSDGSQTYSVSLTES